MKLPNLKEVIITHYGCSSFDKSDHKIFWIGAVYYEDKEKKYFYASDNEVKNVEEYHSFLKTNSKKKVYHWSMNSPLFGFTPISQRYEELTSNKLDFNFVESYDLSEFFKTKYGINYIDRSGSRLNNLAKLNSFSGHSENIEISTKNNALKRLELLFSIYQAEEQDKLEVNITEPKKANHETILLKLKEYKFDKLQKVSDVDLYELSKHIFSNDLPYQIAYLDFLSFIDYLLENYCKTKIKLHKNLAKILNTNERAIRGNINVLSPSSNEDKHKYTSHLHIEKVKNHYQNLK